jgi:hypothetical protein
MNVLGYPKAALFGFCVALVSCILVAVAKAELSCIYGTDKIEKDISGFQCQIGKPGARQHTLSSLCCLAPDCLLALVSQDGA